MTCPRCGTRSPRIKYCRVGFICLVCGCPWDEEEEDERAWGINHAPLFCAVHPPFMADRPPATKVPRREWPIRRGTGWIEPGDRDNWLMQVRDEWFAALCYEEDIRNAAIDFCECELQKLWEKVKK